MKKTLSILLLAVLCLSLFSCYVTPKDEANVLTAEEYFARPFSTEFYGRGPSGLSANGGKLDVTAEHSVFDKGPIELTLYFALSNNKNSYELQDIEAYKIRITSYVGEGTDVTDNSQYIERTVTEYDPNDFLGFYEGGTGCVERDETPLPEPEPCKYNHSETITVSPDILVGDEGYISFHVFVKHKDNDEYTSGASTNTGSEVYYRIVGEKVYLSNLPFTSGAFVELAKDKGIKAEDYTWQSDDNYLGVGKTSAYCILDYDVLNDEAIDIFRIRSFAGGKHELSWCSVDVNAKGELRVSELASATFTYDGEIDIVRSSDYYVDQIALLLVNDDVIINATVGYDYVSFDKASALAPVVENSELHTSLQSDYLSEHTMNGYTISPVTVSGNIICLKITTPNGKTKNIF